MKLVWSAKFTRSVKKLARHKPEALDRLEATLQPLEREPYHSTLRTHNLSGDFKGCWACAVGHDLRIVFEFVRPRKSAGMEIHLLNVGTHDGVY